MHLLTTPLLYRLITFQKSEQYTRIMGIILSIMFTVVMVVHMVLDEFLLHAVTFGSSVLLIVIFTIRLIPRQIPDAVIRKHVRNVTRFGICRSLSCQSPLPTYLSFLNCRNGSLRIHTNDNTPVCFLFGYMIWLVDEFTCRYLLSIRHSIGLPLAFLFEFHAW